MKNNFAQFLEHSDIQEFLDPKDIKRIKNIEEFMEKWRPLTFDQKEAFKAILEGYDREPDTVMEIIEKDEYCWTPGGSISDYVDEYCNALEIPEFIRPYVDFEKLDEDIASLHQLYEGNGGLIELQ